MRRFAPKKLVFKRWKPPAPFRMPKPGSLQPSKPLKGQPWLPFAELQRKPRSPDEEAK